jgi:hypothetical protein
MIGDLSPGQIDQVLHSQLLGRLGVVSDGMPYIIPIAFAFDGKFIYAHSRMGTKIEAMRKNPFVCFQVDQVDRLDAWRSVLAYGKYEELNSTKDVEHAAALLADRFDPLPVSGIVRQPSASHRPPQVVEKQMRAIYFKISLEKKSGKFEKVSSDE